VGSGVVEKPIGLSPWLGRSRHAGLPPYRAASATNPATPAMFPTSSGDGPCLVPM
jgi:hypothetical protein